MNLSFKFIPTSNFFSYGLLTIPECQGTQPTCRMISNSGFFSSLFRNQENTSNILLEAEKGNRKVFVIINSNEIFNKLNISNIDFSKIKLELDAAQRVILLKEILKKQERGNLLWTLCSSSEYSHMRKNSLGIVQEIHDILESGPISIPDIIRSFEALLEEYQQDPYDAFFPLSKNLLEKIFSEKSQDPIKDWTHQIFRTLNHLCQRPEHLENNELKLLVDKMGVQNPFISSLSEQVISPVVQTSLNDNEIRTYLGLDTWQTEGDKQMACDRIIKCFKDREKTLNLSCLGLTSLPQNLKLPFVRHLNLSSNKIKNISSLANFVNLHTVDLSFCAIGGAFGILNFQPLKKLEHLYEVKLCYTTGDKSLLIKKIKEDLINCESVTWTDSLYRQHSFKRLSEEPLGEFLKRRRGYFRSFLEEVEAATTISPPDTLPSKESISEAIERLQLSLDVNSLVSRDPNIASWLNRLAVENGYKGLIVQKNGQSIPAWKDPELLPILSNKVQEILVCALEHPVFFDDILTPILSDSITNCGDRTLYYFNEIVRRMELFKAKDLPLEKAIDVFKKYFPIALIKKISKQSIEERGRYLSLDERESLEKEELEVVLDLLIRFQKLFHIPIIVSGGCYGGAYKETRKDFLNESKEKMSISLEDSKEWVHYLVSDPEWKRYLFNNKPSLEAETQEKEQAFIKREIENLENLADSISNAEYLNRYHELSIKNQSYSEDLLSKETEKILKIRN